MRTYKIDGVILRTNDFGDANRVVTVYTKSRGKLELNAYGVRRARSPMAGVIQPFNHISAEVSHGAQVDTIREADVINFYSNLTAELERIGYASILFETVNRMTLPNFPETGVYELLVKSLPALDKRNARIASLIGVGQFMEFSGVQLSYFHCVNCGVQIEGDAAISLANGGAVCMDCVDEVSGEVTAYPENLRETFRKILNFDWREDTHLNFSQRQIDSAEGILWRYVKSVLGTELNAIKFLKSLN